jgi:hypothetical protein
MRAIDICDYLSNSCDFWDPLMGVLLILVLFLKDRLRISFGFLFSQVMLKLFYYYFSGDEDFVLEIFFMGLHLFLVELAGAPK